MCHWNKGKQRQTKVRKGEQRYTKECKSKQTQSLLKEHWNHWKKFAKV